MNQSRFLMNERPVKAKKAKKRLLFDKKGH